MSLKELVQRPAIRRAFRQLAGPQRSPLVLQRANLLIESRAGNETIVGHAFDYMARAKVVRELRELDVKIFVHDWVAESAKESLRRLCKTRAHQKRWQDFFLMARACFADYELGKADALALASCAQYLAHAEVACRVHERYFDPDFRPEPETTEELTRMIELFDPAWRFAPRAICLLNPSFVGSESIGGADADLLTDNLLTDFKATKRKRIDGLLQLVGYAALARDGGFVCGGQIHSIQIEEVAIYFARFGVCDKSTA